MDTVATVEYSWHDRDDHPNQDLNNKKLREAQFPVKSNAIFSLSILDILGTEALASATREYVYDAFLN